MRSGNGHDVWVTQLAGESWGAVGKVRSRRWDGCREARGTRGSEVPGPEQEERGERRGATSVTLWTFSGQNSGSSWAGVRCFQGTVTLESRGNVEACR